MLTKELRRDAIRNFKEKKPAIGIYAVRSSVTGHAWVGATRNLEATKNSCWFQLRNRLHRETSLQQEWDTQGESVFQYQVLERFDEDLHALEVDDQLKVRRSHWASELDALRLL